MKLGKIILAIALVVVGLGMYAGSTWTARQVNLVNWNWLADEEEIERWAREWREVSQELSRLATVSSSSASSSRAQ